MPVSRQVLSRKRLLELTHGGGAGPIERSIDVHVSRVRQKIEPNSHDPSFNLTFGAFSVGGVFEYFDNLLSFKGGDDADGWVAGGGAAYEFEDFVLGAQYSHQSTEVDRAGGGNDDFTMDRALVTAIYPLGPGIDLDAEIAYT